MDGRHSVNAGGSEAARTSPFRQRLLMTVGLLGLIGLGVSLLPAARSREPPTSVSPAATVRSKVMTARVASPRSRAPEQEHAKLAAPKGPAALEESAPREAAASEALRHPHPITPEHERIFEENNRVAALNGAMDQGDYAALRRMNARYRRDYPEDEHVLQEGYDLIADCLEARSPRTEAAARRFWHEQRASSLRRYVRRYCLEGH